MSSESLKRSDHFDGKKFFNRHPGYADKSLFTVLKWKLTAQRKSWPEKRENKTYPLPPTQVNKGLSATFINHSTFLIQIDGLNILTDPQWSYRASPVSWAGPGRVREPGIKISELPPIDVILISHDHYDHMDLPSLKKIQTRFPNVIILVGLKNKKLLNENELTNVHELDWSESTLVGKTKFIFEEAQHWSARGLFDKRETLWGSFVIEAASGKIYFAGDTGYAPHFARIGKAYGPFDLSLLPIGAYEPRWFMRYAHMNPSDAAQAHLDLKSKNSLGMHFGTFSDLTDEGIDDPIHDLKATKVEHFMTLDFGETKTY